MLRRLLAPGCWTLDFRPWTLDLGLWTLDFGLWTLDFGLWTLNYAAGRQSSTLRRTETWSLYSLSCGANARSKRPTGSGPSSAPQRTASRIVRPSVTQIRACFFSDPIRRSGRA